MCRLGSTLRKIFGITSRQICSTANLFRYLLLCRLVSFSNLRTVSPYLPFKKFFLLVSLSSNPSKALRTSGIMHNVKSTDSPGSIKGNPRMVSVIGACVNEGQHWYTGVETAPDAFRKAGIMRVIEGLGCTVRDAGNVKGFAAAGADVLEEMEYYPEGAIKNAGSLGRACHDLHKVVSEECRRSDFVLTLGGDHSIAVGTISAVKVTRQDIAVVWVDAHADCNTPETSPSGNFHGMPVGLLLGWFSKKVHPNFDWIAKYLTDPLPENRLAFIGLRDVDEREKELLRKSNILVYSMIDVDNKGISRVMEEIIEQLSPGGCRPIHLSFDIDGMDPDIAPGTGTRAKGGLTFREGRYICTKLAETGALQSMDLVEVNPTRDEVDANAAIEHGDNPNIAVGTSKTVKLGMDLIEFALGKRLI